MLRSLRLRVLGHAGDRDRRTQRLGQDSLAGRLAERLDAPMVQLEQLYPGWDGLQAGVDLLVEAVLVPLSAGLVAQVPRYDWLVERFVEPWPLEPPELLIVEGVGAGARAAATFASVVVWLELAAEVREERALARDGDVFRPYWRSGRPRRMCCSRASRRPRELTSWSSSTSSGGVVADGPAVEDADDATDADVAHRLLHALLGR